jgi:hypothetical protein
VLIRSLVIARAFGGSRVYQFAIRAEAEAIKARRAS